MNKSFSGADIGHQSKNQMNKLTGANRMSKKSTTPRKGAFFHWCTPEGKIMYQGQILTIGKNGHTTAQLFEWYTGYPSKVADLTPEYLRACNFYSTSSAMNNAYERGNSK